MFIIVIIGIVLFVIGLLILEFVIRSVIDSSETARNIREIRGILSKLYPTTNDSDDVNYIADYIDCPTVDISYDETDRELTLNFEDTRLAKSYAGISSLPYSNSYMESISLTEGENLAAVKIKLKEDAKYFTGNKDTLYFYNSNSTDFPYMDIQFFNNNKEF